MEPIPERTNAVSREIVDGAFQVHSHLGPGFLESVYEACLAYELRKRGLAFERQTNVPIYYDSARLAEDLRLDLLVEDLVIVEVKAVERTIPLHKAQLLTYLRLTGKRLGLLINFNKSTIEQGIDRVVL